MPISSLKDKDSAPPRTAAGAARIASIDIFRGLTVLVMVFVNDVSGVKGLPSWTYHVPPEVNGMTYVDMVFPAFLFIVGMSIPLAIERRIAKGDGPPRLWAHVILRSLSLVVLGLLLANHGKLDARLAGIGATSWSLLAFTAVLLLWNVYPRSGKGKPAYRILRWAGLALLICVLALFRRREQGHAVWLDFSYVEILGLIGWTYLAVSGLYLISRKTKWAPPAFLAILGALNVFSTLKWIQAPGAWPFEAGLCSIGMAGVVASAIFFGDTSPSVFKPRALRACGYAAILLAAGWVLSPLGVSKNLDTPAWCLYCAGANVLLFLVLYWIADVRHRTTWAGFVKPAGSNTLLTYLLPWMWYTVPALGRLSGRWSEGLPGVFKALAFTGVILAISAVLTRLKIRLQL